MELKINFKEADTDFTPAEVTREVYEKFEFRAVPGSLLVLKPEIAAKTKGGIVKSDQQIADEVRKMDYPMTVLEVDPQISSDLGIVPNTKVVVNRITATNIPSPVEGFEVVFVRIHEVLAIKK